MKYKHKMLEEIFEQPQILENLLDSRIDKNRKEINFPELKEASSILKNTKKIIFLACGSSYHACLIAKYLLDEFNNLDSEVVYAHEFVAQKRKIEKDIVVIAVSQSGQTGDLVRALDLVNNNFIIGITNTIGSRLVQLSNISIYTHAGEERALGATKSFTSQLLVLYLIMCYINKINNKIDYKKIIKDLLLVSEDIKKVLSQKNKIEKLAKKISKYKDIVILGNKYNYPVALEGALKLKEATYIHAEAMPKNEIAHGPLAILDKSFLIIILGIEKSDDKIFKKIKNTGSEIISTKSYKKQTSTFINVVEMQLLSYYIAVNKKINVDVPRNLNKFVK